MTQCSVPRLGCCLCCTFGLLSERVWHDIEAGRRLASSRPGLLHVPTEDSVTDYLILDLARAHSNTIQVARFNSRYEGKTCGADWEIWFCNVSGAKTMGWGIRMQAKRVNTPTASFSQIAKRQGGHAMKQLKKLEKHSARSNPPLWPAYCFYGWFPPPSNPIDDGCRVASSDEVRKLILKNTIDASTVRSRTFPWTSLVCWAAGDKGMSLPEWVRNGVSAGIGDALGTDSALPPVAGVPSYISAMMGNGVAPEWTPSRSRWVVVISEREKG